MKLDWWSLQMFHFQRGICKARVYVNGECWTLIYKAPVFTDEIGEIWNQYPFGPLSTKVLFTMLTDDPDSMRSCRWRPMCTDDQTRYNDLYVQNKHHLLFQKTSSVLDIHAKIHLWRQSPNATKGNKLTYVGHHYLTCKHGGMRATQPLNPHSL